MISIKQLKKLVLMQKKMPIFLFMLLEKVE